MLQAICLLFGSVIVFGAVFTPPIYSLLLVWNPELPWPFSRVYDRVAMLGALIFCVVFRHRFGWGELRESFRVSTPLHRAALVGGGMVFTAVVGLLTLPLVVGTGELEWADRTTEFFIIKTLRTLPSALLIAVIEESFFRVLLLQRLLQTWRVIPAVLVCTVVYVVVHFIAPIKSFVYPGYSPFIGFEYVGEVIKRMIDPATIYPFIGLTLVGVVLAHTMIVTRSIYLCIGLHAGWILAVKLALHATKLAPGFQFASPFEQRYFLVSEPYGWLSIVVVWLLLLPVLRHLRRTPA
jgi:hypothetical protein